MKSTVKPAQTYFDRVPKQWDALYGHENKLKYAVNRWLRKGLFERRRLTFEHCGDLSGARVLDIGCGTGRFSIECALRGAAEVVGIDFAPSMIEYSSEAARQMNVAAKCRFVCGDFIEQDIEGPFDVVLALGFFDYIKDAAPVFNKVATLRPGRFLASFPRFTVFWGIQRHIRYYWIKRCPIFYYTHEQLRKLYENAPFETCEIISSRKGFFGIAGRT